MKHSEINVVNGMSNVIFHNIFKMIECNVPLTFCCELLLKCWKLISEDQETRVYLLSRILYWKHKLWV